MELGNTCKEPEFKALEQLFANSRTDQKHADRISVKATRLLQPGPQEELDNKAGRTVSVLLCTPPHPHPRLGVSWLEGSALGWTLEQRAFPPVCWYPYPSGTEGSTH